MEFDLSLGKKGKPPQTNSCIHTPETTNEENSGNSFCTQVTIFQISIQFQICQKPIPFYVAIIILLPQLYSLYISYLKSRRRLLKHSRISWIWVGLKEKEPRKILRIKLAESVTSLIIYIVKRFAHKSIFIWYL